MSNMGCRSSSNERISGPIIAPGSNPSATFIAPAVSASRLVNAS